jgi:hypothetical protein
VNYDEPELTSSLLWDSAVLSMARLSSDCAAASYSCSRIASRSNTPLSNDCSDLATTLSLQVDQFTLKLHCFKLAAGRSTFN